jgi:glyoxylase-like metal-dependent hydrolase (beta-lactamase superfamily II)
VDDPIAFAPGDGSRLDLEVTWHDGTDLQERPAQVHHLDDHTAVVRQSLRTSAEAPFVVLLFGNERALLLDTGDGSDPEVWPLRQIVDGLVDGWLAKHPRDDYSLLVVHTHGHADHTAGDVLFVGRPGTKVVGAEVEGVKEFFGLYDWPHGSATLDLGERRLVVIPSPGHHETAISVLDPYTGFLFSGDTVYPGRLYVKDMPAFLATMDRLGALAEAGDVSHVLGCHIELDRTGRDYPLGVHEHPKEVSPFMSSDLLGAVRDAARNVADDRGIHRFDGFVIYNGSRIRDQVGLLLRSWRSRLRR